MKTSSATLGWILLGLCLGLAPAVSFAQERSSRGHRLTFDSKPEARRYNSTKVRSENSATQKVGWFFSKRRASQPESVSVDSTSNPQAPHASTQTTRILSRYGTATATVNTVREIAPPSTQPSKLEGTRVSFLPDGTVITSQTTYIPTPTTFDNVVLNPLENPLYHPDGLTTASVQFPNSAMSPPPPPVTNPSPPVPDLANMDLSNVLRAELVSPGVVKSPHPPYFLMDVQGLRSGSLAQDPASQKLFRVP